MEKTEKIIDNLKGTNLFESLDIPEDTKLALSESFDKAVLVEAVKLAESKEDEYEEYMMVQMTEMKSALEGKLDSYLDAVVEEFVSENTFAIDESIKSEKYGAVLEGFNSLMIASGVEIAQIAESKEVKDAADLVSESASIEKADAKVDALMETVLELKAKNAELLKTGLIKESTEDMTEMQKDKFLKLAQILEFNDKEPLDFIEKLDTIAESIKVTKVEDKVEEKVIVESEKYDFQAQSRHLY